MTTETITRDADAFAEHLFGAALHGFELFACYVGDRLGWYRALAEADATPAELAVRTNTDARYAREWLEQQAVVGWLEVAGDDEERRYHLPAAAAEVLTDDDSLAYLAPLARFMAASFEQLPALLTAYRTGGGVSWAQFGADAREGQAEMNRPWYEHQLPDALRDTPAVDQVLGRPGARIADIGCGGGWSTIAIARTYPDATVVGYDIDEPSVAMARANAAKAGVDDRVRFEVADVESVTGEVDAVFFFECVHDMPHPVEALAVAHALTGDDGIVVVMDEAVGDRFQAPGDEVERLMYGFSLAVCLPDCRSHDHSAATGTVIRPSILRRLAQDAGFADIDVLPIEDFGFWRFYELVR